MLTVFNGATPYRDISLNYSNCTKCYQILHALGFWHEQMRPDRDDYIKINFDNISPAMKNNFNKMDARRLKSFGQGTISKKLRRKKHKRLFY